MEHPIAPIGQRVAAQFQKLWKAEYRSVCWQIMGPKHSNARKPLLDLKYLQKGRGYAREISFGVAEDDLDIF